MARINQTMQKTDMAYDDPDKPDHAQIRDMARSNQTMHKTERQNTTSVVKKFSN
jgi:hypothetical protein